MGTAIDWGIVSLRKAAVAVLMLIVAQLIVSNGSGPRRVTAAGSAPKLSAVGGLRGWYKLGDHVVVVATVKADELLDGAVEVLVPNTTVTISRVLQVAAGTEKQVMIVVPTSFDGANIDLRVTRGGQEIAKTSIKLTAADTVELVGVMPGLAARIGKVPKTAQLSSGLGRAEIEPLTDEQFTLGATGLEVYDTIVAVGGDLQSLDDLGKSSLFGWINRGGRLLLDDDAGLDKLPPSWRPGTARYAIAGRGEVRLVSGLAGAGKFGDIIEPSQASAITEGSQFLGGEGFGNVQDDLAARAGVRLPSLTPIVIALLGYATLIGPLCYFVLRRRRKLTFAWIAVPVLSLVAATGVLLTASGWRDSGHPAAVAFVDGYPGGSESQLTLLTFQRSGGTTRVTTPKGWQIQVTQGGISNFEVQHRFLASSEGGSFQARLDPGQVTTGEFLGPSGDVGLGLQGTANGKKINGTVTNNTSARLADVAVFSSGDAQLIGPLEAGESKSFEISGQPLAGGFSMADRVWSRPDLGIGSGEKSELAEFGTWSMAASRTALYSIGLIRAAAWTDGRPGEVSTNAALPTRTVLSTTTPISPGKGDLSAGAIRTVQVRAPFNQFGGGNGDSATRYVLPPGLQSTKLVIDAVFGMTSVELWNGKIWMKVAVKKRLAPVPPEAVRDGVVLLRVRPDANFSFDPNQMLFMRGATPKDAQ